MAYRDINGVEINTNIKKNRIDRSNPCHNAVISSQPYEYWRFGETVGNSFSGTYNRSEFNLYDNVNDYTLNASADGIRTTTGVEAGRHTNNENILIAPFNDYINNSPNVFTLEFWVKLRPIENNVIYFGNDLNDFGLFYYDNEPSFDVNQFLTGIDLEEIVGNNRTTYNLNFFFRNWDNEDWVFFSEGYGSGSPTNELSYTIEDVDLGLFHHIIIQFDGGENGLTKLIFNEDVVYEDELGISDISDNIRPVSIGIGKSYVDTITQPPYVYDEIAYYERIIDVNEYENHFKNCVTLPSISGWNPEISSKYFRFNTGTSLNDEAQLTQLGDGLWNTVKGYKSNNSGRVQFEIKINENNSSNIAIGLSDLDSSSYSLLGKNVPCSENSLALFYDGNFTLQYSLNRVYDEVNISTSKTIQDGTIVGGLVNFEQGNVKFFIDNDEIINFDFSPYITNPNFFPSVSVDDLNYTVTLNSIGPFLINDSNFIPWGSLLEEPNNIIDIDESFEWEDTYQDIILRDNPSYYWRFQENIGFRAFDEINNYEIEHQNDVRTATTGSEGFGLRYINSDRSFSDPFFDASQWYNSAIEFWINYSEDLSAIGRLLELRTSSTSWYIRVNKRNNIFNEPIFTVSFYEEDIQGNTVYNHEITLEGIVFDEWNHVVLTFSEEQLFKGYVNGIKGAEICGVKWATKPENYFFSINSSTTNSVFFFDELAFYDRELSLEEIHEHYLVGSRIVSEVQDLNLFFRGIPNTICSTEEFLYSIHCGNKLKYWGYSHSLAQWIEFDPEEYSDDIVQITCSYNHMLYLVDNTIYGKENNIYGQLNSPNIGNDQINMISAGDTHSMMLLSDGSVRVWGNNNWGQKEVPDNVENVVQIASGESHNLVLRSNGSVIAWGRNDLGQCDVPEGLNDIIQITAGSNFSVALRTNGELVIWGDNTWGVLDIPQDVFNIIQVSAIGSAEHIIALKSDGTIYCWGFNRYGQCDIPSGLPDIDTVSTGSNSSFAIDINGDIHPWGIIQKGSGNHKDIDELFDSNCS